MRITKTLIALIVTSGLSGFARFSEPEILAADEPQGKGGFSLVEIDGKRHSGTLTAVSPVSVTISTPDPVTVPTDRIVRIEKPPVVRSAPIDSSPQLLMANGDRIALDVVEMTDIALRARWVSFPDKSPTAVPLETIRGVVLAPPEGAAARFSLARMLESRRESSDLALLSRGDRLPGEILKWSEKSMSLKAAAGEIEVERNQIQAVGFNDALVSFPRLTGQRQLLQLTDGSQLTVTDLSLEEGELTANAAFGASVAFRPMEIASIRFLGGRIESLSEKKPESYRQTPFISGQWPLEVDRTAGGRPLRIRGTEFPRGFGVHSRSEIHFLLDGEYEAFSCLAGIDDETGGKGSAVFVVVVDGKRVFVSPPQTGTSAPLSIGPIAVRGSESLTLIVEYGPLADIQDHADWCDPVLVRVEK